MKYRLMTSVDELDADAVDAAVEAACAAVWNTVHGDLMGPWPDGCPEPERFRAEEREALLPALESLCASGLLLPQGLRVTLDQAIGRPDHCRVEYGDRVVFDGRGYTPAESVDPEELFGGSRS